MRASRFLATDIASESELVINHLDRFPIEVNTAPFMRDLLLPGIGVAGRRRFRCEARHGA